MDSLERSYAMRITFELGKHVDRLVELAHMYASAASHAALYEERLRISKAGERSALAEADAANERVQTLEREKSEQAGQIQNLSELLRASLRNEMHLERSLGGEIQKNLTLAEAKKAAEKRATTLEGENKRLSRKANRLVIALVVVSLLLGGPLLGLLTGLIQPPYRQAGFNQVQLAQIEEILRTTELTVDPQALDRLDRISQRMHEAAEIAALSGLLQQGDMPFPIRPDLPEPKGKSDYLEDYHIDNNPLKGSAKVLIDPALQVIYYGWTGGGWSWSINYRYAETIYFPDGSFGANGVYYVAAIGYDQNGKINRLFLSDRPVEQVYEVPVS